MAKPVIQFSAVAYNINGKTGYRPQLGAQDGVYDRDFCQEVVTEKRLAMSPDELLHALEMVGEVGPAKVALDGRPRGFTKLLKWNRFATGNLESPSSPWNESCKAIIKPQLMGDATKLIDATFQNVTEVIGVKLNDVTYIGAKTVQNVLKFDTEFSANGSHMEFMEGDSATLTIGEIVYALTCTSSDVSHAVFAFPQLEEAVEAGTQATFVMKSRGGVEGGQVYTVKKTVTLVGEATPPGPKIVKVVSRNTGNAGEWGVFKDALTATCKNAEGADAELKFELIDRATGNVKVTLPMTDGNTVERLDDSTLRMTIAANPTEYPDGSWANTAAYLVRLTLTTDAGSDSIDLAPIVG